MRAHKRKFENEKIIVGTFHYVDMDSIEQQLAIAPPPWHWPRPPCQRPCLRCGTICPILPTANNYLFDSDCTAALAPYDIYTAAPTNALVPDESSQQIYSASGDAPTDFLLWLATPGIASDVDLGCIDLMHLVSQFAIRLGRPATKCNSMPPWGAWSLALLPWKIGTRGA